MKFVIAKSELHPFWRCGWMQLL